MITKNITWLAVGLLVGAALVLSACTAAPEAAEPATVTDQTTTTTPEAPTTGPQYGGTHVYSLGSSPTGFDPQQSTSSNIYFTMLAYESPLEGDLEGAGPRGSNKFHFAMSQVFPQDLVIGHLIERWEFSDPLTLIYYVRQGVYWQDKAPVNGRELDAEDVALSLERLHLVPRFLTGYWKWVDSIEATSKYTVEIKLNTFNSMWKQFLGHGWYVVVAPRELVDTSCTGDAALESSSIQGICVEQPFINDWKNVNGTGPFMLTNYISDTSATFERNPNYWQKTYIDGKEYQLPFLDTVKISIITDPSTRMAAFRTGKLDVVRNETYLNIGPTLEANKDILTKQVASMKQPALHVLMDMAPTDDIRVRRALMMALDKQDMLDKLYEGRGVLLNVMIPEGMEQFIPIDELPAELAELFDYNLEKAKQLLTEAGYADGFKTEMLLTSGAIEQDVAALILSYWAKIGVTVDLKVLDPSTYTSVAYAGEMSQITLAMSSVGGYTFPESQVLVIPGSARNWSKWISPVFEGLIDQGFAAASDAEVNDLMRQIQLRFLEELPVLLLPAPYLYQAWWPWLQNYDGEVEAAAFSYRASIARMWIDESMKKDMGY